MPNSTLTSATKNRGLGTSSPNKPKKIESLNDVPREMKDKVNKLIEKKIQKRFQEELELLQTEVKLELEQQRMQQKEIANQLLKKEMGIKGGHDIPIEQLKQSYLGQYMGGYPQIAPRDNHSYYTYGQLPKTVKYPYGQVPQIDEEKYIAGLAAVDYTQGRSSPTSMLRATQNGVVKKPSKFEVVIEEGKHKQEYVVEPIDPKYEAMQRRKAYDALLKEDVLIHGKSANMNATGYLEPSLYQNREYPQQQIYNPYYGYQPIDESRDDGMNDTDGPQSFYYPPPGADMGNMTESEAEFIPGRDQYATDGHSPRGLGYKNRGLYK